MLCTCRKCVLCIGLSFASLFFWCVSWNFILLKLWNISFDHFHCFSCFVFLFPMHSWSWWSTQETERRMFTWVRFLWFLCVIFFVLNALPLVLCLTVGYPHYAVYFSKMTCEYPWVRIMKTLTHAIFPPHGMHLSVYSSIDRVIPAVFSLGTCCNISMPWTSIGIHCLPLGHHSDVLGKVLHIQPVKHRNTF